MEEACGTKNSLESVCTLFKLPPDDSVPSDIKIVTQFLLPLRDCAAAFYSSLCCQSFGSRHLS